MNIDIKEVIVEDRMRVDLGDIDELVNSIREHTLIQPIVVTKEKRLVAGGRRLAALVRLGVKELVHAEHFVFKDEVDPLKLKGMELEENLRRKNLSWQEEVLGKQQLLLIMQQIHGVPSGGRPRVGEAGGFGVNKLAAMLGENVATTSQDLSVASMLQSFPSLAKAENKSSALSQLKLLGTVASMTVSNKSKVQTPANAKSWTLHEWDFRNAQVHGTPTYVDSLSTDLVWTDLPYGGDVDVAHDKSEIYPKFDDSRLGVLQMLEAVAVESFRVLKNDRYAVFCFGFNFYADLCLELTRAGFHVNPVPCIWCKPTKFGANPLVAYCISYEPLLVAWKGSARFIRAGQSNVIHLPTPGQDKLHLVQKPVELVERFILDMTVEGSTIVDWCAGTGTTGVAAHRTKRKSILFEKDSAMCLLAKTRLGAL